MSEALSKSSIQSIPFTLIEVLVAVTVCGAVFVVLLSGFGQNLKFTGQAEDYTTAIMLAKSKMTEFEAQESMEAGPQRGDFGDTFDRFRWEAEIEQDSEKPLYTVNLTVF